MVFKLTTNKMVPDDMHRLKKHTFLAAVLKACLCAMLGFLAFNLRISSLFITYIYVH